MKTNNSTASYLKDKALKNIDKYLTDLILNPMEGDTKKASNISYWINDYINYIKNETKFSPMTNMNYKRGDIIKVNLGFNIGNEEGGLHYGIVINNPLKSSGIVTIIPLTSLKSNKKLFYTEVNLGNCIFDKAMIKVNTIIGNIKQQICISDKDSENFMTPKEKNILSKKLSEIESFTKELERMKKTGSIALISQITTISKQRIHTPTIYNRFLEGISLSNEELDKIDKKIIEIYTKNSINSIKRLTT